MEHVTIVAYDEGSVKQQAEDWKSEHEDSVKEIVDIEYSVRNNLYIATITYIE